MSARAVRVAEAAAMFILGVAGHALIAEYQTGERLATMDIRISQVETTLREITKTTVARP